MPWTEVSIMDQRAEFVAMAQAGVSPVRALCRRFAISPATAYKWLKRAQAEGLVGLADRSRRPHASPRHTTAAVEALVVGLRDDHPAWGGRKITARLRALGHDKVPSPSTVTGILRRHGRLTAPERSTHAWRRFERPVPNQLWQMDFKGHVPLGQGSGRLHPLTVLDDHSRYCLVLGACGDEQGATVQTQLVTAFRRYGLPDQMLADNGGPWGDGGQPWTQLGVWLLQLGVGLCHGRPYHPQTQGKDERFHRTLRAELLQGPPYADLRRAQRSFDDWRRLYNLERPHEACALKPPISRYHPSERTYPETLPAVEYGPDFLVRRVRPQGSFSFHAREYRVGGAFAGQPIGLLPATIDGVWTVYFSRFRVGSLDERTVAHGGYGLVERQVRPRPNDDGAARSSRRRLRRERQRLQNGTRRGRRRGA